MITIKLDTEREVEMSVNDAMKVYESLRELFGARECPAVEFPVPNYTPVTPPQPVWPYEPCTPFKNAGPIEVTCDYSVVTDYRPHLSIVK